MQTFFSRYDDCSKVANDQNWKFIESRDDNFEYLENILPKFFDIILIDSFIMQRM